MTYGFSNRNGMCLSTAFAVLLSIGSAREAVGQAARSSSLPGETTTIQANLPLPELTARDSQDTVVNRPIEDFLNAQGSTSVFYQGKYAPGLPDYAVGWTTGGCPGPFCPPSGSRIAAVDYAGGANKYLERHGYGSLGTKTEGSITERRLPDGRAEVTLVLHTTNALTFMSTWDASQPSPPESAETNARLFGASVQDILGPIHRRPALADSALIMVFINPRMGAPMPDLVQVFAFGAVLDWRLISFSANATGSLPNGVPATAAVRQLAFSTTPPVGDGGFVTESDDITPSTQH
jgi:hypothetical protein